MPRPTTTIPTWATGATGIAATTEPTGTEKQNGWAVAQRPPAQYFNWFWNRVGAWLNYEHESRVAMLPMSGWRPQLTTGWLPFAPSGGGSLGWQQNGGTLRYLLFPLNGIIEYGAPITKIEVMVKPGAARATQADRMKLEVWEQTYNFTTPAAPAVANPSGNAGTPVDYDDGTTNAQVLSLTEGVDTNFDNIVVDLTKELVISIRSGNTDFLDAVYGARITWGGV
jgi:hypothetical protein